MVYDAAGAAPQVSAFQRRAWALPLRRILTSTFAAPWTVMAAAGRMVTERPAYLELSAEREALRIRQRETRRLAVRFIIVDFIDPLPQPEVLAQSFFRLGRPRPPTFGLWSQSPLAPEGNKS